jgi:hypothetical protein
MAGPKSLADDERIQAFVDAYREDDNSELIAQPYAYVYLTIGDLRGILAERDRLAAYVAELEAAHARCADLYMGGRGPAGVIEATAFPSSGCNGCGCCTHEGCHRFADATCPTDSLGDSVCPCTEE